MLLSNKQSSLLNVQVLMALLTNLLHKSKYFISTKTFRLFIEQIMLGVMKNAALKCAALTVLSRSTFKKTLYATFDKVAQKTQI